MYPPSSGYFFCGGLSGRMETKNGTPRNSRKVPFDVCKYVRTGADQPGTPRPATFSRLVARARAASARTISMAELRVRRTSVTLSCARW